MSKKILQQGAEALIILEKGSVTKRRIKKSYRLSSIDDRIRKLRTRSEGKLLEKASQVVNIPKVIKVDEKTKEIIMEFVKGGKLSENLDSFSLNKQKKICKQIGEEIAKLHDSDIIHGDLTTSNMVLTEKGNKKRGDKNSAFKIFFIDFGLGFHSQKAEDKAVDIHLLRQALEAKHFRHWQTLFAEFLKGYEKSKHDSLILQQFKKVEARGRYKEAY